MARPATQAAIAGGLPGTRDGASSIPDGRLSVLQVSVEFSDLAEEFARRWKVG